MTKTDIVSEDLKRRIQSGEFKPGDKLPSIRALAEHYGVSTMVLQKTIQRLQKYNLLESSARSGLYIPTRLKQYDVCGLITCVQFKTMLENFTEAYVRKASEHNCIPMAVPVHVDSIESMLEKGPNRLFVHASALDISWRAIDDLVGKYDPVYVCLMEWENANPVSAVLSDWQYITEQTLRVLLEAGHKKIVFICQNEEPPKFKIRQLTQAGTKFGLKFGSPEFTWCSRVDFEVNMDRIRRIFEQKDPPTALFARGDMAVFSFADVLRTYYPKLPQLDMVGAFNSFWSNLPGREFASWKWDWDEFWDVVFQHKDGIEYYRPKLIKWNPEQKKGKKDK